MVIGDLIQALGGTTAVARALSVKPSVVSNWRNRKSIPSEYWTALVGLAEAAGAAEVTFEAISRLHAKSPPTSPAHPHEGGGHPATPPSLTKASAQ